MNEVLTRAEMEAQFDGEWVLVADPKLDAQLEVQCGRVVSHSPDREVVDAYQGATEIRSWASLYFGPPTDAHIWLSGSL